MHDKLVDAGKPGDRVEVRTATCLFFIVNLGLFLNIVNAFCFLLLQITGIYRAMSIRVGTTQRTVKSIFKVNTTDNSHITIIQFFVSETASIPELLFSHGILSLFRHSLIAFT
jgi:hypothetical protein